PHRPSLPAALPISRKSLLTKLPFLPSSNGSPVAVLLDVRVDLLLQLDVLLQLLLVRAERLRPLDVLEQRARRHEGIGVQPSAERLVDDLDHAGMRAFVEIDSDVVVREERVAQRIDVVAVTGQEGPARQ